MAGTDRAETQSLCSALHEASSGGALFRRPRNVAARFSTMSTNVRALRCQSLLRTIALISLAVFATSVSQAQASRPNILLIITDQQYGRALGAFMSEREIKTPAMDRLA